MYIPLYYTSFLFGITSLLTTGTWMQSSFLWLMGFSILCHNNYEHNTINVYVNLIDKVISHYIGARSFYQAITCDNGWLHSYVVLYHLCLAYNIWLYYVRKSYKLPSPYWQRWHATLHITSCLGCYLLSKTHCMC